MSDQPDRTPDAREAGAREERRAIIAMVEQHLRQMAHGHGAAGAVVLEHLLRALQERDAQPDDHPITGA